jgi:hypothetical protein
LKQIFDDLVNLALVAFTMRGGFFASPSLSFGTCRPRRGDGSERNYTKAEGGQNKEEVTRAVNGDFLSAKISFMSRFAVFHQLIQLHANRWLDQLIALHFFYEGCPVDIQQLCRLIINPIHLI